MDTEDLSETTTANQEDVSTPGAVPSTVPATAQEAGAGQANPFAGMNAEQIQAEVERRAQSMKDREIHRARLQWEQQEQARMQQAAQQAALEGLDDEEYGRTIRQQQAEQQKITEEVGSRLANAFIAMQRDALDQIQSSKTREDLERRASTGEIRSFSEFHKAVIEAAANERLAKERAALEKQIRQAAINEGTADIVPVLGQGTPLSSTTDLSKLSPEQLIALGWAQEIAKKQR